MTVQVREMSSAPHSFRAPLASVVFDVVPRRAVSFRAPLAAVVFDVASMRAVTMMMLC